ncbi:hypothetical protein JMJ35_006128 [Cladonia borealis]|uniref:Uncharacterized protein n=1 Tax=Cladonia borealis TaxID=184061 RepID=A0AA39QYL6_9LECA|nr:hypothetical protein JMJ35_006128 [Cladonia borealis]
MSEAAPAPEIRYETDAEPPLWLEKPLPETPMSKEPLSAMEEWFPTSSYQYIQLPARKTSAAAIPATSRCKIGSQLFVKQEGPLPERSAVESLESLALAFGGWPTPTSKPATLSEPPYPINDGRVSKESDHQEPMERSQISLTESSTRAEIRNFSRPLGTPRAPLEFSQLPLPNVSRPPRLVGSSRFPQGRFVSPAAGDVATASNQLSSVNGGRFEGKHENANLWQKGDADDSWGKERSCSRCELM